MNKSNKIWYLFENENVLLKNELYKIISDLYVQLVQVAEPNIIVHITKLFTEDLYNGYKLMELDEVRFALDKYIRENDPPIFVNIPTLNKALRDYKKTKALRKQTNQIDQYQLYKKRIDTMDKALQNREIKKIGNVNNNK